MGLEIAQVLSDYRFGDPLAPDLEFSASGNTGNVNWSTDKGFLTVPVGPSTVLSPLNRSALITISAQDDNETVTATLQVWATFPVQSKWNVESDVSPPIASWPLAYENRTFSEYWGVLQFFKYHGPVLIEPSEAEDGSVKIRVVRGIPFYLQDIPSGEIVKGYFDSNLRRSFVSNNFVNYSFQFKTFEYVIPAAPVTGLFTDLITPLPEYGEAEFGG